MAAIGDALPAPATEAQQQEMLDAIDELELAVACEVLNRRAGSALRAMALVEIEKARDADRRGLVSPRAQEIEAEIAACPTPYYHETHRYCPSCPWTEES